MDSNQIRQLWTSFFAARQHRAVPSSSLIPPPDERTLLFTNAGMNQMKPYFMGLADPPARRMTSIQKCFRTSDIEEVGDSSHCTFFEMLGNFSVGDYFKAEVIPWAWELITKPAPDGLGLDRDRIWTTVHETDDESFDLWRGVGIPEKRIVRFDESENYWFMIKGGAGPCGPNTEIYYDFGAEQGCRQPGCSPPTHDCGRFLEIWNLVFMALYQEEDGRTRRPLPMQNVDTGAGLERWAVVHMYQDGIDWQGNPKQWDAPPSIFDTDLFRAVIAKVEELTGLSYAAASEEQQRAMRVVAEHTRAATFLIADGVTPANDGRGYVLRRLIRSAVMYGSTLIRNQDLLGPEAVFLNPLPSPLTSLATFATDETARAVRWHEEPLLMPIADSVVQTMAEFHGNLVEQRGSIKLLFALEESNFKQTLDSGRAVLASFVNEHQDGEKVIPGDVAFRLHDTHGFPVELTKRLVAGRGFGIDEGGFEALMQEQRTRSRAAAQFDGGVDRAQTYAELALPRSEFLGYENTRTTGIVLAILLDGTPVQDVTAPSDARIEVVLDRTPFYAEGGGQVGDRGELVRPPTDSPSPRKERGRGGEVTPTRFVVEDTQAVGEGGVTAHAGRIESGTLRVGDTVEGRVDESRRADTMRNHTATHILHAALRHELGTHVRQAGSLVTPDRLRFDFTHLEAMTVEQVRAVEALANRVVRDNLTVHIEHMSYEKALEEGALAFFGDKYADTVRVVGVCDVELHDCFSHELCGGTHVHHSGEVGAIIITGETSIGAGMRRIEAVTGRAAWERLRGDEDALSRLSTRLRVAHDAVEDRVEAVLTENDRLRRQVQSLERQIARQSANVTIGAEPATAGAEATVPTVGGVSVIVRPVPEATSVDFLRDVGDALKQRHNTAVILLGAVIDEKPTFVAMSTPDIAKKCPAGDVVRIAAQTAGGNGGGRPESAQGGGTDPSKLNDGLAAGRRLIEERLSK
ncbi:MAG TPA: alanine--tRNA ligase [Dehalococcoidia bacterium]|nr:alanine--tRNA ligase [Dehalococcoidia bacterium]